MSRLNYKDRLLSGPEIRLLSIIPAEHPTQPVQCQLRRFALHEAPPYEALSYVWGDPTTKIEIVCNGDTFMATLNLFHALTRLRLPDAIRTIWADAICINQDDLDERAHQVTLMGQIYSGAERVIVWLGQECSEAACEAKESMDVICNACRSHEKALVDTQGTAESGTLPDIDSRELGFYRLAQIPRPLYDRLAWKALKTLFDRPWFRRVWCIQEIRLSRDVICLWGKEELSWSNIGMTTRWLRDVHDIEDYIPGAFPEEIEYMFAFDMYDTEGTRSPLLKTLIEFRDFQATDPRDKVYGLLGLVQPGKEADAVLVDYGKPVKDVYADAALRIIQLSSTLDILDDVEHLPNYTGDDDFHSWAPRLDQSTHTHGLSNRGGPYRRATWDEEPVEGETWDAEPMQGLDKLCIRPGFLRLTGLFCSRVASVGPIMDDIALRDLKGLDKTHPFLDWWNEVLETHTPPSIEGIRAVTGMARTLTAGWDHSYDLVDQSDEQERQEYFSSYFALIDHLFRVTGQKNTTLYEPLSMAVYEGDREKFEAIAWRVCDQRRLFKLHNGWYGIGPACMQTGDIAVILSGGDTPNILREIDQHFCYMGQAYIDDAMRGQLVEDFRAGKSELQEYFLR